MSNFLMYIIAVYFCIILFCSDSRYKVHSAIILIFTSLNLYFEVPVSTGLDSYISNRGVNMAWDGVTAVALTMFLAFDKLAGRQALILAFAVLCHIMVIYDLQVNSNWFSLIFYNMYDELIILIGLLQMAASYNGFITACNNAFSRIQNLVLWSRVYTNCLRKGLSKREKRETET